MARCCAARVYDIGSRAEFAASNGIGDTFVPANSVSGHYDARARGGRKSLCDGMMERGEGAGVRVSDGALVRAIPSPVPKMEGR